MAVASMCQSCTSGNSSTDWPSDWRLLSTFQPCGLLSSKVRTETPIRWDAERELTLAEGSTCDRPAWQMFNVSTTRRPMLLASAPLMRIDLDTKSIWSLYDGQSTPPPRADSPHRFTSCRCQSQQRLVFDQARFLRR